MRTLIFFLMVMFTISCESKVMLFMAKKANSNVNVAVTTIPQVKPAVAPTQNITIIKGKIIIPNPDGLKISAVSSIDISKFVFYLNGQQINQVNIIITNQTIDANGNITADFELKDINAGNDVLLSAKSPDGVIELMTVVQTITSGTTTTGILSLETTAATLIQQQNPSLSFQDTLNSPLLQSVVTQLKNAIKDGSGIITQDTKVTDKVIDVVTNISKQITPSPSPSSTPLPSTSPTSLVTQITLIPQTLSLYVFNSMEIRVFLKDSNGNDVNKLFTYQLSKQGIVKVNLLANNILEIVGESGGLVDLTVSVDGISKTANIEVLAQISQASPPLAPTGLNSSNITETSFTLSWTAVTGATSYKVYKDGALYADNIVTTSQDIISLSPATVYNMEVSAVNAGGESIKSAVLNLMTVPLAPTGLNKTNITATQFTLSWSTVTGATSYNVYKDGVLYADNVAETIKDITGLNPATIYNMQVSSINASGESAKSEMLNVTTFAAGTLKWSFTTTNYWIITCPAIGSDGTIYAGWFNGRLYTINPDGSQKWEWYFSPMGNMDSSPAIGSDGTIYAGWNDGRLYAINPDGTQKWAFTTGGSVNSSPAIGSDGTIYVGSYDNKLYAINPNGAQKWAFITGNNVRSSPAIGNDGTIYVGSNDKKLYALNLDGTKKWEFLTGGYILSSPAIGSDGTIYVGSNDYKLYAINPNGAQKWTFATGSYIFHSPAVGSDGTIYVGSKDKKLYAIKSDGTKKWDFQIGSGLAGISSPTIASDGTIYIGSDDYKLYALTSSSAGLADSSWPKFHKNNKNTGLF